MALLITCDYSNYCSSNSETLVSGGSEEIIRQEVGENSPYGGRGHGGLRTFIFCSLP